MTVWEGDWMYLDAIEKTNEDKRQKEPVRIQIKTENSRNFKTILTLPKNVDHLCAADFHSHGSKYDALVYPKKGTQIRLKAKPGKVVLIRYAIGFDINREENQTKGSEKSETASILSQNISKDCSFFSFDSPTHGNGSSVRSQQSGTMEEEKGD